MVKLAAFDLGSNAVRMVIADLDDRGRLIVRRRIRVPLRLGTQAFLKGAFSEYTLKKAAKIFIRFRHLLDREQIVHYRGVGTSAYRDARNGDALGQTIYQTSGIRLEKISGDEEGELILRGIRRKINLDKKNFVLADIGGGSLELTVIKKGSLKGAASFNLGTVRVLNSTEHKEKIVPKLFHSENVAKFLQKHINAEESFDVIGTGGNVRRMLKLKQNIFQKKADYILPLELEEIYDQLKKLSPLNRSKRFKMKRDRADVILPALQIMMLVVNHIQVKKIYCPNVGLANGVLCELAENLSAN